MRVGSSGVIAGACGWLLAAASLSAQEPLTVQTSVLFYGDNTEFRNPFREGETIFGAAARVTADIGAGPGVTLSLGGFLNQRFGSDRAADLARPIVSMAIASGRSTFIIGTLPPADQAHLGPDRMGPHRLLPPLQRETLSFERPYEAGLQWRFDGARLAHDAWLVWQRLNTREHRERLDAGMHATIRGTTWLSLPVQFHIVHEGGQLFDSGPVSDSLAAASGVDLHGGIGPFDRVGVELYALASRFVPDRSRADLSGDGRAFFGRVALERSGWRAHLIAWRGRNFIKDEGDPNYLSVRQDGNRYRGIRDYAEAGLARRFTFGKTTALDVSARWHRVERDYSYSYRVSSTVGLGWRVR